MFEVGNIVVWDDRMKDHLPPIYANLRYEVMGVRDGSISIKGICKGYLIRFTANDKNIIRDINYERQLKLSQFRKKKKLWNIFKKK